MRQLLVSLLLVVAACSGTSAPVRTPAPDPTPDAAPAIVTDDPPDTHLGHLDFALTGGNAEARALFLDGLLAIHSFWYTEASTVAAPSSR